MERLCSDNLKQIIGYIPTYSYCALKHVKLFHNWVKPDLNNTLVYSALYGHRTYLLWLVSRGHLLSSTVSAAAARGGHFELLKELHKLHCSIDVKVCNEAIIDNHYDIVLWAKMNGITFNASTCSMAARHGNLAALQWLRRQGCPWSEDTCLSAARGGHLSVLKYARENGCPWSEHTCSEAAIGGHLDVLLWLEKIGVHLGWSICNYAVRGGNLAIVKYIHTRGFPWTHKICRAAAEMGHFDILKYAYANGAPLDIEYDEIINTACFILNPGTDKQFEIIKWLHENGLTWNKNVCDKVAREGNLELLKCLCANECPIDYANCKKITKNPAIVKWIDNLDSADASMPTII